jgi:hypothetical protein
MKLDMLPGDEVVMTLDREGRSSLLTGKGSVSAWLWVIRGSVGLTAVLRAMVPCGSDVRAVTLEAIFPQGDLAKVYHWLAENDTAYALCHGLNMAEVERMKKFLRSDLADKVHQKAGELGQRPGVPAGMPTDETRPIPLAKMPEETVIFNTGAYRAVRA